MVGTGYLVLVTAEIKRGDEKAAFDTVPSGELKSDQGKWRY
jgi:hypothetical protein